MPYFTVVASSGSPGGNKSDIVPLCILTRNDDDIEYVERDVNEMSEDEMKQEKEEGKGEEKGGNGGVLRMKKDKITDSSGMLHNKRKDKIVNAQNMRNLNSKINSSEYFIRSGISAPKVCYLAVKGSTLSINQTKIKEDEESDDDDDDDDSISDSGYCIEDSTVFSGNKSCTNDVDMNHKNKAEKKWKEKELQQAYLEKENIMRDEENAMYTSNVTAFLRKEKVLAEQIKVEEYLEKEKQKHKMKLKETIPWGAGFPVQDLLRLGFEGDEEGVEEIGEGFREEEGISLYFHVTDLHAVSVLYCLCSFVLSLMHSIISIATHSFLFVKSSLLHYHTLNILSNPIVTPHLLSSLSPIPPTHIPTAPLFLSFPF